MILLFIIGIPIVLALVWAFVSDGKLIDHQKLRKNTMENIKDDNYSRVFTSSEYASKIFFDEKKKKFKIANISLEDLNAKNVSPTIKEYSFDDIADVEIVIDNKTLTKVSKSEAALGATIGGAVGGGVGAIIGGGTASSSAQEFVKSIHLRITVEDYDNPYYDIAFFSGVFYDPDLKTAHKKSSPEVQKAIKEIDTWFRYFKLAMRDAAKVAH
ncbi:MULTISPECIES: hypothetical protein [Bacillus]|uniref:hypothetical protein n=1 Tax=Bacillus TaxID=1386 RepID=UPI0006995685|nr:MULTISPECIES: hypothetical protein [Bacillus]MEC0497229.1 hypothetical protein [Bacillus glycinifermentans]MEC0539560.1 hypothetical protein [Bacillus glycinifermentans]RHJ09952.1 hypothetical protein DW143_11840 [Bacillus sonorensis]WKB79171.1 hypothetical protein QYM22_10140 [Bacillus glycinifermentans]SCA85744.1 putative phage immunity protein [Bacillus glycinifermentans]